jgi:hypothetical protein
MDDQTKTLLAAAVVGGYVLGRTKKGRLALTAATFLTGKKLVLEPRQLVAEALRRIGDVPQVAELQERLRAEGLEAGRKALSAVADRGLGSLADAIGSRTAALGREDDETEDDETEDDEGEYEGEGEPDEDEYEEEPSRRRQGSGGSRRTAPAKGRPAKKTAVKTAAPAKSSAARRSSPAKEPASSPKKAAKKTSPRANRRR